MSEYKSNLPKVLKVCVCLGHLFSCGPSEPPSFFKKQGCCQRPENLGVRLAVLFESLRFDVSALPPCFVLSDIGPVLIFHCVDVQLLRPCSYGHAKAAANLRFFKLADINEGNIVCTDLKMVSQFKCLCPSMLA